jgi:O-glycosyl hydrolase
MTRPRTRALTAAVRASVACLAVSAVILTMSAASMLPPVTSARSGFVTSATERPVQEIRIDGRQSGRTFDGIGALSAGASSRLLIDYPEPQRSQVLDYLFKPGHGAALQILRVEIGGDTNSTAGAEPSHMRTPTDLDCDRGYEWWLMREAKRRNPDIILSGLAWGAPGWFDGGFWSQDNIDYQIAWLECARTHGLTIDYLGGWNESETFDPDWFVALKRALRERGFHQTKLIAADGWGPDLQTRWKVAEVMAADPEFAAAVDVAAVHYPCGSQYNGAPYDHCPSTDQAKALGIPLWSGEQGSQKYDIGAGPLAKAINRSYIDGRMTATVNWSLVAAWYTSIPYAGLGLMRAYQPWSGYFEASQSLWSVAHTTQFTEPGWRYIDSASGYLDGGGSFVSLRAPEGGDFSTVIETIDATAPQQVRLSVAGGLKADALHVWQTDLRSPDTTDWFRRAPDLTRVGGGYHLTLQPGHVYTVTTTTGQGKGKAAAPPHADRRMRQTYVDSFETTKLGDAPRLLSDFNGRFEAVRCAGNRAGTCIGQQVTIKPIEWRYVTRTNPLTVIGDPTWSGDYAVSVDAYLGRAPHVDLIGRADGVQLGLGGQPGYRLRLAADGTWTLIEQAPDRVETALASGRLDTFDPTRWYRLGLSFKGTRIRASINGKLLAEVRDSRHNRGQVGLMVGDWTTAQFDNLAIRPTAPPPKLIPQNTMRATATSAHLGYEASNVLDANPNSMWHTSWDPPAELPQSITLDLGKARRVRALIYTPRYDGNPNGTITSYTLYSSVDGEDYTAVAQGTWQPTAANKTIEVPTDKPVRYLRLEAHSGNGYAAATELNVVVP